MVLLLDYEDWGGYISPTLRHAVVFRIIVTLMFFALQEVRSGRDGSWTLQRLMTHPPHKIVKLN